MNDTMTKNWTSPTGDLIRDEDSSVVRPARAWRWHHREIESGRDLRASLRSGPYAWPGGYAVAYLADDCEWLCPDCVRGNLHAVLDSIRCNVNDGWRVIGLDSTENYDEPLPCANCYDLIG